jgi:hypothetical protein
MIKINQPRAIILAAIITALAAIIVVLIQTCKVQTIEIKLIDAETGKGISGEVFIDASKEGFTSTPEDPAVLKIKMGNRVIRAESADYKPAVVSIKDIVNSRNIKMEKNTAATASPPVPLSFTGWESWELRTSIGSQDNEIIVNGTLEDAGGFFKNGLQAVLRGKTLILYFSNVGNSTFNPKSRMVRLTYNRNDFTLQPGNESVAYGGYIPAKETPPDRGIEYRIPDDFDGKLGFVFYQADLNDLRITAMYK